MPTDAPRAADAISDEQLADWERELAFPPTKESLRNISGRWRGAVLALIAALRRAAREPDAAKSALEEIRRHLDLRLPSEQAGPEWEQCVRVPIARMTAIDAVLTSVLGEPTITNEPMPSMAEQDAQRG